MGKFSLATRRAVIQVPPFTTALEGFIINKLQLQGTDVSGTTVLDIKLPKGTSVNQHEDEELVDVVYGLYDGDTIEIDKHGRKEIVSKLKGNYLMILKVQLAAKKAIEQYIEDNPIDDAEGIE